jgi:hypothetical protein
MDPQRFDTVARLLSLGAPRRRLLAGFALSPLAGLAAGRSLDDVAARKTRKPKKPKPNVFGCLDVGKTCKRSEQCCSNVCKGKRGKKRCRAHDTGGCAAGHSVFGDDIVPCESSSGETGRCGTTTGNAGYCVGGGDCRPCRSDVDCQALCGPRAACVLSPEGCSGVTRTICAGPDDVVCPL